jgi:hypothetical protein
MQSALADKGNNVVDLGCCCLTLHYDNHVGNP